MSISKKEPPDLVEYLETDEPPEPFLGYHQPDYSLKADRVVSLSKDDYEDYNDALIAFAKIAKKENLRLHFTHMDLPKYWTFECFYAIEVGE